MRNLIIAALAATIATTTPSFSQSVNDIQDLLADVLRARGDLDQSRNRARASEQRLDQDDTAQRILSLLEDQVESQNKNSVLDNVPEGYTGPTSTIPIGYIARGVVNMRTISDYPGPWRGTLVSPIISPRGEWVIAPAGSTVVGTAQLAAGRNEPIHNRMEFTPTALVWPDGQSFTLDGQFIVDQSGVGGVGDLVDYHADITTSAIIGGAAIEVIPDLIRDGLDIDDDDGDNITDSLVTNLGNEASTALDRYASLVPTVEVRPGTPFQIFFFRETTMPTYRVEERFPFFTGNAQSRAGATQ